MTRDSEAIIKIEIESLNKDTINITIAKWLGWEQCSEEYNNGYRRYWIKDGVIKYISNLTAYYPTNAAFDLLDMLVERGWDVDLSHNKNGWSFYICKGQIVHFMGISNSKSAAICEAICALIEQEGK